MTMESECVSAKLDSSSPEVHASRVLPVEPTLRGLLTEAADVFLAIPTTMEFVLNVPSELSGAQLPRSVFTFAARTPSMMFRPVLASVLKVSDLWAKFVRNVLETTLSVTDTVLLAQ